MRALKYAAISVGVALGLSFIAAGLFIIWTFLSAALFGTNPFI